MANPLSLLNPSLAHQILRNEWGYQSWVTSDTGASDRVADAFGMCAVGDMSSITLECLEAGTDVEM